MAAQHDVFVAYAGPDRDLAEELVARLRQRGVAVRWDGHLQALEEGLRTLRQGTGIYRAAA
jgi:hypothetical protein